MLKISLSLFFSAAFHSHRYIFFNLHLVFCYVYLSVFNADSVAFGLLTAVISCLCFQISVLSLLVCSFSLTFRLSELSGRLRCISCTVWLGTAWSKLREQHISDIQVSRQYTARRVGIRFMNKATQLNWRWRIIVLDVFQYGPQSPDRAHSSRQCATNAWSARVDDSGWVLTLILVINSNSFLSGVGCNTQKCNTYPYLFKKLDCKTLFNKQSWANKQTHHSQIKQQYWMWVRTWAGIKVEDIKLNTFSSGNSHAINASCVKVNDLPWIESFA